MTEDPLTLIHGDCVEVMRSMDEASVDAIVTDPPYGLEFMGKEWDKLGAAVVRDPSSVGGFQDGNGGNAFSRSRIRFGRSASSAQQFHEAWATEALRVLKPGGHMLSFGGTRTFHRMTVAIEDAGFEIRDCLMWLYGSGFPKSLDVSKAMDKAAGEKGEPLATEERWNEPSGIVNAGRGADARTRATRVTRVTRVTEAAQKWEGWGTALKPAWEPIILARKPLIGTVAENVERHGTGALNIDGTRIATTDRFGGGAHAVSIYGSDGKYEPGPNAFVASEKGGRWPANVLLDEEAAAMLDEQSGERPSGKMHPFHRNGPQRKIYGKDAAAGYQVAETYGDSGGASRFFYVAKASKQDRGSGNSHPTCKPVNLMRYLCRLITPPRGLVLDPFAGSGTTGQAALAEGFRCVLIEKEAEYVESIKKWRGAMQLGTGL